MKKVFLSVFLFAFALTGCLRSDRQSANFEEDARAEAIRTIIAADEALGAVRNHACVDTTLAETVRRYVAGIDALDFSRCPEDFTAAFRAHRDAWAATIPFFEPHGALRGEMHVLLDSIGGTGKAQEAALQAQTQPIWDTWAEVEAMILQYEASPNEETGGGSYLHIRDPQARELLRKAVDRAGGLEAWQDLETLHFQKYYALYDASGAMESEVRQTHDYTFQPEHQINIRWTAEGEQHEIDFANGQAIKTVDGQVDASADPQSLLNNVLSAGFVISIPFKLLDKGAEISYAGLDTLEDNRIVEVLKVRYDPAEHEHHSTPDTWHHYFDRDDHRLIAYLVQHADHYSYVKNLEYTTEGGFLFPTKRDSYRVDSLRNILYLRARYEYGNYRTQRSGQN